MKCLRVRKAESLATLNADELHGQRQHAEQARHRGQKHFSRSESSTREILEIINPQQCSTYPGGRSRLAAGRPAILTKLKLCKLVFACSSCSSVASEAVSRTRASGGRPVLNLSMFCFVFILYNIFTRMHLTRVCASEDFYHVT